MFEHSESRVRLLVTEYDNVKLQIQPFNWMKDMPSSNPNANNVRQLCNGTRIRTLSQNSLECPALFGSRATFLSKRKGASRKGQRGVLWKMRGLGMQIQFGNKPKRTSLRMQRALLHLLDQSLTKACAATAAAEPLRKLLGEPGFSLFQFRHRLCFGTLFSTKFQDARRAACVRCSILVFEIVKFLRSSKRF